MAKRKQTKIRSFFRFVGSLIAASFLTIMLSGCSDEKVNPLGTEKLNGEAPKEEAYAVQMDCSGLYNGVYLPQKKKDVSQLYPLRFTGKWKQIPNGTTNNWYMATTDEVGARVDLCATMTRCVFDFWDYEFYDNPGTIQLLLDNRVVGTYNLARMNSNGYKILDYVVATQKNTVATASVVLLSGRMVLTGVQLNVFNPNWPY